MDANSHSASGYAASPRESEFGYFDPESPVACYYGDLPHWRQEGATYFVTFRLGDSIPMEKLRAWQSERMRWIEDHPEPLDIQSRLEYYRRFPQRMQLWLDAGYGKCILRDRDVRAIVEKSMNHFDGERYLLDRWVIMPNHVHSILTPVDERSLEQILHSWKSFSAHEINKTCETTGRVWQKESFDHIVRNAVAHERIRGYIDANPSALLASSYSIGSGMAVAA